MSCFLGGIVQGPTHVATRDQATRPTHPHVGGHEVGQGIGDGAAQSLPFVPFGHLKVRLGNRLDRAARCRRWVVFRCHAMLALPTR